MNELSDQLDELITSITERYERHRMYKEGWLALNALIEHIRSIVIHAKDEQSKHTTWSKVQQDVLKTVSKYDWNDEQKWR